MEPGDTVVDLWVDRAENRFDKDWNAAGLESRVHARKDASGRATGWTAVALLPWSALAAKAPSGTALPPKPGDRWRFNVYRIERPFGPGEPEKDVHYLAWSPTGERSFHVPAAFRELEFAVAIDARALALDAGARGLGRRYCGRRITREPRCATRRRAWRWAVPPRCGPAAPTLGLPEVVSAALDEVDRLDRLMSHYRTDSPLSRLNREAANGPVAVEPELLDFLAVCLRWSRESDGAFDVTVGPADEDVGLLPRRRPAAARSGRSQPRSPASATSTSSLDREHGTVRFDRPGVELDLGGIGKGYAVDRVVELLRRRGVASALVSLGGSSVYGLGAPPGAEAWEVGIQDPTDPGGRADGQAAGSRALRLGRLCALLREGRRHLLAHHGPENGPAGPGVLSVAVLSASATDGDALDNVFFVQGLRADRAGFAAPGAGLRPRRSSSSCPRPGGHRTRPLRSG